MAAPVLVLGASGRAGRLLRGAWPLIGAEAPRALFQARRAGPGIDLAGPCGPDLAEQLAEAPSAILVLAGVTAGSEAELAANSDLARAGLELGAALGTPLVMLCSSAAVYRPDGSGRAFAESEAGGAERPYGRAKLAMEAAARDWIAARSGGPAALCLRLANIVGADMLGDAVRRAAAGDPLVLDRFADGQGPRRSYLSPVTLARVAARAAAAAPAERFTAVNLAEPGGATAMADLLGALGELGHPVPWSWRDAPGSAVPSLVLDLARQQALWPGLETAGAGARALAADWIAAGGGQP
ncbi:NAD(P)-dependent oxidoreductase [Poseidonocella sp. HB161398]|uniref:NAD-dependent epimerase/dehydratase family protein n=1 Tax=Poseidonocella sp. HB161398 TaxID=2320855 RepID=UPI0011095149|nr:NAD-dependent epimerase/dehydratase family protein [Poseidonocella sp. HB161398]